MSCPDDAPIDAIEDLSVLLVACPMPGDSPEDDVKANLSVRPDAAADTNAEV
jgi:hypothetical protein